MAEQATTGNAPGNDKKARAVAALGQLAVAYLFFLRSGDSAKANAILSAFRKVYNANASLYKAYLASVGLTGGTWRPPDALSDGATFDARTRETIASSIIFLANPGGAAGSAMVSGMDAFPGPGANFNNWFDQTFNPLMQAAAKEDLAFYRMYETYVRNMDANKVTDYLVQKATNAINNDFSQGGGATVPGVKPPPATTTTSSGSSLPAPRPPAPVTPLDEDNPLLVTGRVAKPAIPWALIGIGGGLAVAIGILIWGFSKKSKKGKKSNDDEI